MLERDVILSQHNENSVNTMKKTTTISFRISEDLKSKLQARAKLNNQNLTEYTKSILDNSHTEKLIDEVKNDLDDLESNVKKISFDSNNLSVELKKISDEFKNSMSDHVKFYENKSNALAKNTHDFEQELKFAISSFRKSRSTFFGIMILSIITNLTSVSILAYLVFR